MKKLKNAISLTILLMSSSLFAHENLERFSCELYTTTDKAAKIEFSFDSSQKKMSGKMKMIGFKKSYGYSEKTFSLSAELDRKFPRRCGSNQRAVFLTGKDGNKNFYEVELCLYKEASSIGIWKANEIDKKKYTPFVAVNHSSQEWPNFALNSLYRKCN